MKESEGVKESSRECRPVLIEIRVDLTVPVQARHESCEEKRRLLDQVGLRGQAVEIGEDYEKCWQLWPLGQDKRQELDTSRRQAHRHMSYATTAIPAIHRHKRGAGGDKK